MQSYSHELDLTAREHSRIQALLTDFALSAAQELTPNVLRDEFRGLAPAKKHHLKNAPPSAQIVIKGEKPFGLDDALPNYELFAMLPINKSGAPIVFSTNNILDGASLISRQSLNARDAVNATHKKQSAGQFFLGLSHTLSEPEIAALAHPRNNYGVHAAMVLLSNTLAPLASRRNRQSTYLSGGIDLSYNPSSVFMRDSDFYVSEHGVEITVRQQLNQQLEKPRRKPISSDSVRLTTLGNMPIGIHTVLQQFRYEYTVGSKEPPKAYLDSWSHTIDESGLALLTLSSQADPYVAVTQAVDRIYSSDFN